MGAGQAAQRAVGGEELAIGLVGVALAQGAIASVDQPVVALVPEWTALNNDPRTREITVRHLLTMSAGFDLGLATDHRQITGGPRLGIPLAATPGERFAYDNAIVGLLAALIERVAGMPLADYARRGAGATAGPGGARVQGAAAPAHAGHGQAGAVVPAAGPMGRPPDPPPRLCRRSHAVPEQGRATRLHALRLPVVDPAERGASAHLLGQRVCRPDDLGPPLDLVVARLRSFLPTASAGGMHWRCCAAGWSTRRRLGIDSRPSGSLRSGITTVSTGPMRSPICISRASRRLRS